MIRVNSKTIEHKQFPDGTQMLLDINISPSYFDGRGHFDFSWNYENDGELLTIMFLVKHFRNLFTDSYFRLTMPYIPNARMDRTKSNKEVFTLKYFCEIINSLNFDEVITMDPHSHVSEALLNHLVIDEGRLDVMIEYAIRESNSNLVYFPDAGALKRYGDLKAFKNLHKIYGQKKRDWETGEIKGLTILSEEGEASELIKNANVIMVDDIISYGGTMYFSALKLKELGANEINAYATHTENSVLDPEKGKFKKLLDNGTVRNLYTTDSIFTKEHRHIKVI